MYTFIDLCCGFGAMTKAFEKTGLFKCVLAADIDPNMRAHYKYLLDGRKPIGDITKEENKEIIKKTDFDVLVAGICNLNENIFFPLLEIIEETQPKAFLIEMGTEVIYSSFCKNIDIFCKEQGYHFVGYEDGFEGLKLNLMNFGIPEYCERTYCVCIKQEYAVVDLLKLNKNHDYRCYEYTKYNPDKFIEQKRGLDWGFRDFNFLIGTPELSKKTIVENASPIPIVVNIALSIGLDFLKK